MYKIPDTLLEHKGRSLTIREWAEETGIPEQTFYKRLVELKWDAARAIETPQRQYHPKQPPPPPWNPYEERKCDGWRRLLKEGRWEAFQKRKKEVREEFRGKVSPSEI